MTSSSRTPTKDHVVGMAWSLWTELGASGWTRKHSDFAIDPEALILLTAWLRDSDPRLRDEATDWCVRYGQFVSVARLKNLLMSEGWLGSDWWTEFAATVNANSRWQWPAGDADPRVFQASQKSRIESFTRPSLIFLRVRALIGLGARAEILRLLAFESSGRLGVAQIAAQISYSKRNTAEALVGLEMAGVLWSLRVGNRLEYTVVDAGRLASLFDPRPRWAPMWIPIARVIVRLSEFLERAEDLPDSVASVECITLIRHLSLDLSLWDVAQPQLVGGDRAVFERFIGWSDELLAGLENGDPKSLVGGGELEQQSLSR